LRVYKMSRIKFVVVFFLFFAIIVVEDALGDGGAAHMENNQNVMNPAHSTKPAEPSGGTTTKRVPYKFQEQTGLTIREWEKKPGETPPDEQINFPAQKKHPGIEGTPGVSPAMGPNSAKVKLFLWTDFQCPNCMRAVEPLKYLSRKFPQDVQVIFKQSPLPSHKNAYHCALASAAAARQGKFWEFHDLLFKNMRSLGREKMEDYAREAGLNLKQFKSDMEDPTLQAQVEYEKNLASKLGMTGTPGFVINGKQQVGWGSYEGIEGMVKRALQSGNMEDCEFEGYKC